MHKHLLRAAAAVLFLLPHASYAGNVSMDLHTYYSISEEERLDDARSIGTLYEYLSVNADNIHDGNISFVFSGWGRLDTSSNHIDGEGDKRTADDVSAAYFDYTSEFSNFNVRLGRQTVLSNLSYESLSGISMRSDLPYNLKLTAYSGVPEELEEDSSSGDLVSGGRISAGLAGRIEIGAGYLTETDNDRQYRREVAADIWIMPADIVELYGKAILNGITDSYSYSSVSAIITPVSNIMLSAKYENTSYEDYFENAELTIYNLFDHDEDLETAQGSVIFDINDNMSLNVDIKEYDFKEAHGATSYGLGYSLGFENITSKVSYHKTDSRQEDEGYIDEYRLYVMYGVGKVKLSCDAVVDLFEEETKKRDTSTVVIASAGYRVSDALGLAVDLDYSRTPEYDEDYKLFIRAEYNIQ